MKWQEFDQCLNKFSPVITTVQLNSGELTEAQEHSKVDAQALTLLSTCHVPYLTTSKKSILCVNESRSLFANDRSEEGSSSSRFRYCYLQCIHWYDLFQPLSISDNMVGQSGLQICHLVPHAKKLMAETCHFRKQHWQQRIQLQQQLQAQNYLRITSPLSVKGHH